MRAEIRSIFLNEMPPTLFSTIERIAASATVVLNVSSTLLSAARDSVKKETRKASLRCVERRSCPAIIPSKATRLSSKTAIANALGSGAIEVQGGMGLADMIVHALGSGPIETETAAASGDMQHSTPKRKMALSLGWCLM